LNFVKKSALYNRRGMMAPAGQVAIIRKIADTFKLLLN